MPLRKPSGKRSASGSGVCDATGYFTVSGLSFTPSVVHFYAKNKTLPYSIVQTLNTKAPPDTEKVYGICYNYSSPNGNAYNLMSVFPNGFAGNTQRYGDGATFTYVAYE